MSPKTHEERGYWFGFYSNEGNEPPHIHVKKAGDEAKFWLTPQIELVYSYGYQERELRWMEQVISQRREQLIERWYEHFNQ